MRHLGAMCWYRIRPSAHLKQNSKKGERCKGKKKDVLIISVAVLENASIIVSGHVLHKKNVSTHLNMLMWGWAYPVASH